MGTSEILGWPVWSVYTFGALLLATVVLQARGVAQTCFKSTAASDNKDFAAFRRNYIGVYALVMLADWLQGTHMYTLYQSYGVDVGALFLTGFLSSAVFGTFIGSFVDRFGRKRGCMLYFALEIVINTMEHSTDFTVLMAGRVLGGVSTSLLFTSFESWMVTEHRKRGFPEELLASTYSLSSVINGLVAVVAGVVAQLAADAWGHIGPFQLAIFFTALAWLAVALTWTENRGSGAQGAGSSVLSTMKQALNSIRSDPVVLMLGAVSSLFEGAMYTFVFMWVPVLFALAPGGVVPTGLVFSSFMLCISIGGSLFDKVVRDGIGVESLSVAICAAAAVAMGIASGVFSQIREDGPAYFWASFVPVLVAFLVMEVCVGCFSSCAGVMRSRYLPQGVLSSLMNLFRVPLNVLVVVGTRLESTMPYKTVLGVCAAWLALAAVLQIVMNARVRDKAKTKSL